MASITQYFDDGSTLSMDGTGTSSATPATDHAMAVANSGSGGTDFFAALDQFTGLATKTAGAIATLNAQSDAVTANREARELARAKQTAALQIGTLNAQRDVSIATLNAQATRFIASPAGVITIAAAAALVLYVARQR
jgi:hypothetical protein